MSSTFSLTGKLGLDARDFKKGAAEASKAIGDVDADLESLPDELDLDASGFKKGAADASKAVGGVDADLAGLPDSIDLDASKFKAGAADASKAIDGVDADVRGVADRIDLDASGFKSGAREAQNAIGDISDDLNDLPETGRNAGSKAGDLLSSGLVGGFAAAGGVALIGKALNDAMDVEAGVSRVQAQFALTADDAERYGKLGGELYADAWGESVSDTTRSIALVGTELQDIGDIADDELKAITGQVYALSDVFGEDLDAVVRSIGNLLKNDLVDDAEEALDLVTVAFQGGNNKAGDLLDTIDEYSPYWAQLGIDANEALGLIQVGFQNGFRDADKLSDLIKEFGIRVLTDEAVGAFQSLGFAGEEMGARFAAGGETARVAMGEVITALANVDDPLEQNRLGVELFSTTWEDITGPKVLAVLQNIEEGLGDVEGASAEMAETVGDNTATAMEEMKRELETSLADAAGAILLIASAAEELAVNQDTQSSWEKFQEGWDKFLNIPVVNVADQMWGNATEIFKEATETTGTLGDTITDTGGDAQTTGGIFQRVTDTIRGGFIAAADDAAGSIVGLGEDADDTTTELDELTYAFDVMKGSLSERSAFLTVMDSFEDMETKGVEALAGIGLTADEHAAALRDYEQDVIRAKDAVITYAERVGDIPAETVAEINTLIDLGQFDEAERRLSDLERDRQSTVNVSVRATDARTGVLLPATGYRAEGGPVERGGGYIVGEEGPEFFVPTQSGYIIPAAQTAAMFATSVPAPAHTTAAVHAATGIATGSGLTINHYGPQLSAADVSRGYTLARLAQAS